MRIFHGNFTSIIPETKFLNLLGLFLDQVFVLFTKTVKLSLYYALIYPYISYCNLVWLSTYVTSLNHIWLLQRQAVRVITNSP